MIFLVRVDERFSMSAEKYTSYRLNAAKEYRDSCLQRISV